MEGMTMGLPALGLPMETVGCDLCGAVDCKPLVRRRDGMQIVSCRRCGFAFLNPRPTPEGLASIYDGRYFEGGSPVRYEGDYLRGSESLARDLTSHMNLLADLLEAESLLAGKGILDAGCATGAFLLVLKERGAGRACGLELSGEAAQYGREHFGLEILEASVENAPFPKASFDVVCSLEVIEHVPSPTRFMQGLVELARPGGHVALTTPNFGQYRTRGRNFRGLASSFEHVSYFDSKSLRAVVEKAGLEIRRLTTLTVRPAAIRAVESLPIRDTVYRVWQQRLRTMPLVAPACRAAVRAFNHLFAAQPDSLVGESLALIARRPTVA